MSEMAPRKDSEFSLSGPELELDERTASVIDGLLEPQLEQDVLPAGFARRLAGNRPFAPWEVHQRKHWKVPLGIGLGLFGAGAALGLAPLFSLQPATAFALWSDLAATMTVQPVRALANSGELIAEASAAIRNSSSPSIPLFFGLGVAVAAVSLISVARALRPAKMPADGDRSR